LIFYIWNCCTRYHDILKKIFSCFRSRAVCNKPSFSVPRPVLIIPPIRYAEQPGKKNSGLERNFSVLNRGFHLHHHIRWDWVHFMNGLRVFSYFNHELGFGRSRGFKFTVFTNTCKGWHLFFTRETNYFVNIWLC